MVLTKNEKRVMRFLAISIGDDYSINEIAKMCKITPNGAYKILLKLEKEGVLQAKAIANIKAYHLDFTNEKTQRLLEFAFMPAVLDGRVRFRAEDLQSLKKIVKACIFFGSYITSKKEPGDLDVLFLLEQKDFVSYKHEFAKVQNITPVKIQDIVQTSIDLEQNLKKKDPIIIEALRNGIVLWGFESLALVIKNVSQ
ncbi:MAG: hypothetical protein AABX98_01430 [Nanoarchaeota archaeon]